jgi:spermidine synthase
LPVIPEFLKQLAAQARDLLWRSRARPADGRPFVRRTLRYTSLQFNRTDAQSRMLTLQPDLLLIDYTRTMMGVLLFDPAPRTLGMIGLGGGSQAKFCYRYLPTTRVEVVEISEEVIALRDAFRVPADDARFHVHLGDGACFVREHPGRFDALLVDGYDVSGIAPALSSQAFYDDCRDALAGRGVMAVNLYGEDTPRHIERIRNSFGRSMVVVDEPRQSNRVVFAWVGDAASSLGADGLAALSAAERVDTDLLAQLQPVFVRVGAALACGIAAR